MLAFIKRRQIIFALLLGLIVVLPGAYFSIARNRKNESKPAATAQTPPGNHIASHSVSLDTDNDGFPDAAELQSFSDRENFRRWFTLIAEGQFYELSKQWKVEQRDCAGLVRFAAREALRRHDRAWFQKMGPAYTQIAPDVARYKLEQGPLGERLFRTDFGSYKEGELGNGTFSEFADARTLKSFNAKFISRDRRDAQPGDLLFFHQPWVQKFPYHVMIFVGSANLGDQGSSTDWVVYHTGASASDEGDAGTVKKVELSVLDQHPNRRWRPVENNSNFLGFYRLKILD